MRRILDRYILREVVSNWLAVTAVLLIILLTYQLARVLDQAAENQYPQAVVLELIWLGTLQTLSVLMPFGLMLGVVLAFSRLYHDSEMAAALACGVGPSTLYAPITLVTAVAAGLLAWLTLYVGPHAIERSLSIRSAALQAGQFAPVAPGRFRTFGGSDVVVYAEHVAADGTLENVFVQRDRAGRIEVALARRARHSVGTGGITHTITLYDGERFEGVPGSPKFRIMRFAENTIPVEIPQLSGTVTSLDATPLQELLKSSDRAARAELHWRIAMPVMCVVLSLLAVPLSRLRPREGRYARVWLAVLIYFIYSSTVSASKVWFTRGTVPEILGLWWVHVVVIVLAVLVLSGPRAISRLRHRAVPA